MSYENRYEDVEFPHAGKIVLVVIAFLFGIMFVASFYATEGEKNTREYARTANCGYIDSMYDNMLNGMGLDMTHDKYEQRINTMYNTWRNQDSYPADIEIIKQYHTRCHPSDILDKKITFPTGWEGSINIRETEDEVVVTIKKNENE